MFRGETFVLTLFALLGMQVMISGNSFLTLYLGLELLSLSLYALVALAPRPPGRRRGGDEVLRPRRAGVRDAALRHVDDLRRHRLARYRPRRRARCWAGRAIALLLTFGLVFVVSGIAFKLGAAPYHMWVPDVYQGAPTAVTLLIGTAPKLAAFALTMRLLSGRAAGDLGSTGRGC